MLIVVLLGHKRSCQSDEEPFDSAVKKQKLTPPDVNLKDESWDSIEDSFNILSAQICRSLEHQGIHPIELLSCVQRIDFLPTTLKKEGSLLFSEEKKKWEACTTVSQLWCRFGKYFTFYSYRLLTNVVKVLGTKKDYKNLQSYEEKFLTYSKKAIEEHSSSLELSTDGTTEIIVKLNEKFSKISLDHINRFKDNLARVLELPDKHLNLLKIQSGCIELTLHCPFYVEVTAFPLSAEQEAALTSLGVMKLKCGKYEFPSEVCVDQSRTLSQ